MIPLLAISTYIGNQAWDKGVATTVSYTREWHPNVKKTKTFLLCTDIRWQLEWHLQNKNVN